MRESSSKDTSLVVFDGVNKQRLIEAVNSDSELGSLSEIETLEYFLSLIVSQKDAETVARNLLDKFGSLYQIFVTNYNSLLTVPNLTKNAAHLISNFFAIFRRIYLAKSDKNSKPKIIQDIVDVFLPYFAVRETERIYMASFDNSGRLIKVDLITTGEVSNVSFNLSSMVRTALNNNAAVVVLAHNHPAGDWRPSENDIVATKTIFNALKMLNINLADHFIFTNDGYLSFYSAGLMPQSRMDCKIEDGLCLYSEQRKNMPINDCFFKKL